MSRATIRPRVIIICLLLVMLLLPQAVIPAAGAQVTTPVLLRASAIAPPSNLLVVTGNGFSPGGLVYIAIHERWAAEVHEHIWTVASPAVYGPNGSTDPARGYVPAGTIHEVIHLLPATIYGPNGSADPALGYRPGVDPASASAAIYGPNGSQDPALGYVPAAGQQSTGIACQGSLMVRAYDAEASSWSNLLDVTDRC